MMRASPVSRVRPRDLLKWLVLAVVLFALDGVVGAAVALAVGLALVLGQPARRLILVGAVFLGSVPVVVIIHGLPSQVAVSARFALDNKLANHLAFAGLTMLVTGLMVDGARRRTRTQKTEPTQPPGE